MVQAVILNLQEFTVEKDITSGEHKRRRYQQKHEASTHPHRLPSLHDPTSSSLQTPPRSSQFFSKMTRALTPLNRCATLPPVLRFRHADPSDSGDDARYSYRARDLARRENTGAVGTTTSTSTIGIRVDITSIRSYEDTGPEEQKLVEFVRPKVRTEEREQDVSRKFGKTIVGVSPNQRKMCPLPVETGGTVTHSGDDGDGDGEDEDEGKDKPRQEVALSLGELTSSMKLKGDR